MAAVAVDVLVDQPRIAYPMAVNITIDAKEAANNLTVSLFAVEQNNDPDAQIRQFPLGSQVIEQVFAGRQRYELLANIPSSVETPGQYFIAAIVDPVEEIAETNEDDNSVSVETTLAETGNPNIFISALNVDRSALLLTTRQYTAEVDDSIANEYNPDAGGTITVSAQGLGPEETIAVEAFAKLQIKRTDNNTTFELPLYLWNTEAGRYINAYGVDPKNAGATVEEEWLPLGDFNPQLVQTVDGEIGLDDIDAGSAHINFYLPGRLGSELSQALRKQPYALSPTAPPPDLDSATLYAVRNFFAGIPGAIGDETEAMAVTDFSICLAIRPVDSNIVDDYEGDNELCEAITVFLPGGLLPPPPAPTLHGYVPQLSDLSYPLESGDSYAAKGGGSLFAFSMEFGSSASADDRGYIEETYGAIPVTLFGVNFEYASITFTAQLVPDYAGKDPDEESGYVMEQRFLGAMLYAIDLPPTSPPPIPLVSYSKSAPDPEAEQQFFLGPVPMVASGEVTGNFGVEYQFAEFTANPSEGYQLTSSVDTFANLEAAARAGVGIKGFSVGTEGVLRLLEERISLAGGTEIEVIDLGFGANPADFIITQGITLSNEFSGPQGFLNLYAIYSVPGFKKCSWGFITGRCPTIKTQKSTKNIFKTKKLFAFNDILFESNNVKFERCNIR